MRCRRSGAAVTRVGVSANNASGYATFSTAKIYARRIATLRGVAELSRLVGVHYNTIHRWECLRRTHVSLQPAKATQLCKVFGCRWADLA